MSFTIYTLISLSVGFFLINNGVGSIMLVVWTVLCLLAFAYGAIGFIEMILFDGIFAAYSYINHGFNETIVAAILIGSILPLIAGAIIWHSQKNTDDSDEDSKEFKNLANELSEVSTQSEVVINAIGDGVIAMDSKGVIKLINPAAQMILGWSKQDALTLSYKSVMHLVDSKNDNVTDENNPIEQVLNNNQQMRSNNLSLLTKNEKQLRISLVVSPVGEMGSGVIVVFRDITKEKAEEREQFEFISTASHEMRTPVAAIEGYLGLALNQATATIDDRARGFIMKAHESAEHLGHLFQDLLDVSKADDGRMSNNPQVINVTDLTGTIIQELMPKAIAKNIQLIFKPTAGGSREKQLVPVYYVNLDKDHFLEVVNNIIENAIKYTPEGNVVVDINGDSDRVTISVKDSGIGIPAEDMPHLFQKFYRVDNKDTREIGGTGLGLYISRRLVEIMSGRIWAESQRGDGSTFFIELPRIDNQRANQLILEEQEKAKENTPQIAQPEIIANSTVLSIEEPTSDTAVEQPVTNSVQATPQPQERVSSIVPRTGTLTPEQIAAYVARQRELAAAQKAQYEQAQLAQMQIMKEYQKQQLQKQAVYAQNPIQPTMNPVVPRPPDIQAVRNKTLQTQQVQAINNISPQTPIQQNQRPIAQQIQPQVRTIDPVRPVNSNIDIPNRQNNQNFVQ